MRQVLAVGNEEVGYLIAFGVLLLPIGFAAAFMLNGFRRTRRLLWLGPLMTLALLAAGMAVAFLLAGR